MAPAAGGSTIELGPGGTGRGAGTLVVTPTGYACNRWRLDRSGHRVGQIAQQAISSSLDGSVLLMQELTMGTRMGRTAMQFHLYLSRAGGAPVQIDATAPAVPTGELQREGAYSVAWSLRQPLFLAVPPYEPAVKPYLVLWQGSAAHGKGRLTRVPIRGDAVPDSLQPGTDGHSFLFQENGQTASGATSRTLFRYDAASGTLSWFDLSANVIAAQKSGRRRPEDGAASGATVESGAHALDQGAKLP